MKAIDHLRTVLHPSGMLTRTGVAVLMTLAAAAVVASAPACGRPPQAEPDVSSTVTLPPAMPEGATVEEIRRALLDELKTVTLENCTLKRYGNPSDGGYLMCENLAQGVQSAYSYGIDTEDTWGCDVAKQFEVPVHQYDCFTNHRPACEGGEFVFHDECVGPKAETIEGMPFDTIASQIRRNGDAGKPILFKIDVEGAEWDSLLTTPDAVLDQFVQMPMEFHGTDEAKFVQLVRRLKRQFHLVNLHFNNHGCRQDIPPFPSYAYQVLWVNKRVGVLDPAGPSPAPMSPLNMPDRPSGPDCQLP